MRNHDSPVQAKPRCFLPLLSPGLFYAREMRFNSGVVPSIENRFANHPHITSSITLRPMKIHNIRNYTLVLDKVVFLSGVFLAADDSFQFNIKLIDDKLSLRFPDRATAVLERELLVKALKEAG